MKITIRPFTREDIKKKVEWINNPNNNQFLHYDIPISVENTEKWFEHHKEQEDRFDAIIQVDDIPVGTIGLLTIDKKNGKAEYYIAMGEQAFKGKGVAKEATKQILQYAFEELGLNRVYLFTETENIAAQKLFERVGFMREGLIRQDIVSRGRLVDRFAYGYLREEWNKCNQR